MIKEEGHITYTLKGNPVPITRGVIYINRIGKCVEVYLDDDNLVFPSFLYDTSEGQDLWFVPYEDNTYGDTSWKKFEGDTSWKKFEGEVLEFEYNTRLYK